MRNILATSQLRVLGVPLRSIAAAVALLATAGWGAWMTMHVQALERREIVTVQLSRIMGDFVEAEARGGRSPDETKRRIEVYLKAVDASVQSLRKDGRTVLVAEAVVAGGAHDMTDAVRRDVARRMGVLGDAGR